MDQPYVLHGGNHTDNRGTLKYINEFDLSEVRRFYTIEHLDTCIVRGWRGHRIDRRWFYVIHGAFLVNLVQIDNWVNPSPALMQSTFTLAESDPAVLCIPAGYANKIQALVSGSKMIVFADSSAEEAKNDDYLYPTDYFIG